MYIAADNPAAAARQTAAVLHAVEQLPRFPEMGRIGRVHGTRELVIPGTPLLIAYRVRKDGIRILAVLHGAKRWPRQFSH